MPFPPKLLYEGEDIVLDLRPHWIRLARPVLAVVAATALVVLAAALTGSTWLVYALLVILVVAIAYLLAEYGRWTTTQFVVTTRRLIARWGVLSKHGREIPLDRLNDITFHQSVFERLLGAGDLLIESAGEMGQQTFTDIRRPSYVQNEIYRQIESGRPPTAGAGGGGHELSIPEQIEKLADLQDRGVLSRAEFEQKKAQLLDRL